MNAYYSFGMRFRIGRRRYRLNQTDIEALRLLQLIHNAEPKTADNSRWLLRFRPQIRKIRALAPKAALVLVMATAEDHDVRKLAIWLRGLCGGSLGAPQMLALARSGTSEQQCLYARSFQRMGAWAQLRQLAQLPDLRRKCARHLQERGPREFKRRMRQFLAHVSVRQRSGTESALFCLNETRELAGKPAKPLWLIRLVLDRVRLLVSSEQSTDRSPVGQND